MRTACRSILYAGVVVGYWGEMCVRGSVRGARERLVGSAGRMVEHVIVAVWPGRHCAGDEVNVIHAQPGGGRSDCTELPGVGTKHSKLEGLRHHIASRSFAMS